MKTLKILLAASQLIFMILGLQGSSEVRKNFKTFEKKCETNLIFGAWNLFLGSLMFFGAGANFWPPSQGPSCCVKK